MKTIKAVLKWVTALVVVIVAIGVASMKMMPYYETEHDKHFYFPTDTWAVNEEMQAEEVTVTSTDGTKVVGLMLKPENAAKATVFMLHGAGGNASSYTGVAQPLVQNGYQVFIAGWRSFGKSEKGLLTHPNILKDSQAALDYVLARDDVQGTKVVLWGLSLGGQVAIKLARDNKDKVQALVTEGAVLSHYSVAADHSPAIMRPFLWTMIKGPYTAAEDIRHLTNLPKLIIQSHDDTDVPFSRGEELFQNAAEPKMFWAIKGKHLHGTRQYESEYVQKLNQLLATGTGSVAGLE